jgi:phosphonate metabolism protein PhnN/1,5-bisphosphokinase (PRPP-forming)
MLVLVVGPSGAGKDTLLEGARQILGSDPRFHFIRRSITRPADQGPERHEPLDEAAFEQRRAAGGFALTWRAHGLLYGVPADITLHLEQGRVVVANVSRTVVAEAATRYRVRVIEVTAPPDLLARRLAARGREDALDAARRLARSVPMPADISKETVQNDGTIEQGVRRLVAALNRAAEAARQS